MMIKLQWNLNESAFETIEILNTEHSFAKMEIDWERIEWN